METLMSGADRVSLGTAPDAALETDLIAVINRHIAARDLHPQTAAETLAVMAIDTLAHLAWKPGHVQAADQSLREAIRHMRAG